MSLFMCYDYTLAVKKGIFLNTGLPLLHLFDENGGKEAG